MMVKYLTIAGKQSNQKAAKEPTIGPAANVTTSASTIAKTIKSPTATNCTTTSKESTTLKYVRTFIKKESPQLHKDELLTLLVTNGYLEKKGLISAAATI